MRIDRLSFLSKKLKDPQVVPINRFDIGTWMRDNDCGFAACAGGWAGTFPEFRAEGLTCDQATGFEPVYRDPSRPQDPNKIFPVEWRGLFALIAFFELDLDDARSIFEPASYNTTGRHSEVRPIEVARRIDQIVEQENQRLKAA